MREKPNESEDIYLLGLRLFSLAFNLRESFTPACSWWSRELIGTEEEVLIGDPISIFMFVSPVHKTK